MPVQYIRERQIEKPKEGSTKYRPEVDGLRAVAIIPVILFHMGYQWTQGGFVGVDVFFVISGYLITSLILKDHDADRFRFPDFWLRRIRRIFPALVVMVIGTSVASYFLMFRGGWNDVGKQGISAILSFANITMWRVTGDYWGSAAHDSVFLHTWSLSVEEQFYFFYPFLIVFLIRFAKKWVFHVISVIAVISFLLYLYGSQYHPGATFYLLPMRAWELATGCLVAIRSWNHDNKISRPVSSFLSLGGIVAIIACCLFISGSRNFPGYLFLPVIGSVLIIVSGDSKSSMTNRLLSSSPFVFVGKISYSLYLWHWPILVIAKQMQFMDGSLISTGILLSLIVLVSVVSYYFVEKPTRHRIQILKPAFCALVVSLSISFFLCTARDFYDCSSYNKVLWEGQLYNVNPVNS
ncbi:MAG TPA: acyltransferase, partial [Anaerolineales bacterium]|nr:acyltransferase [Anaerolineales bacterium]